jgi:hypothetical protein
MGDPLDEFVRRAVDTVPVPAGLESRVRATVTRRRMTRYFAAVAALLIVFLGVLFISKPVTKPIPEVVVIGPRLALTEPEAPLHVREVELVGRVTATEDGISIRFEGARDE